MYCHPNGSLELFAFKCRFRTSGTWGQGWQGFCLGQLDVVGHAGQTGGTISDFKMYKSSSPGGIAEAGTPSGPSLLSAVVYPGVDGTLLKLEYLLCVLLLSWLAIE